MAGNKIYAAGAKELSVVLTKSPQLLTLNLQSQCGFGMRARACVCLCGNRENHMRLFYSQKRACACEFITVNWQGTRLALLASKN